MIIELKERSMSRVKKLTLPDIARLVNQDEDLKKKLVAALAPHIPDEDAEALVMKAINDSLAEMSQPLKRETTTYRLICSACNLNRLLETLDWENSGIEVICCVCGATASFRFPEQAMLITCRACAAEARIERIAE